LMVDTLQWLHDQTPRLFFGLDDSILPGYSNIHDANVDE